MEHKKEVSVQSKLAIGSVVIHGSVWLVVCFALFVINLLTTLLVPPWFIFPTLFWGLGLFIHAAAIGLVVWIKKDVDPVLNLIKEYSGISLLKKQE